MLFKLITIACLMLIPIPLIGQERITPQRLKTEVASQELDSVMLESSGVDDKLSMIYIQAKAAMLLSFLDPDKSNDLFLNTWTHVKQQTDKEFDKERAFNLVLRFLFPRNPKLAKQLLSEQPIAPNAGVKSLTAVDAGVTRRFKLASELVDVDPAEASALLERSLSSGVTPFALNALNKLNDKDPLLAEFVVANALDGLRSQPTAVSLNGLHLLTAFVFPDTHSTEVDSSLQSLQFHYFSTTYDVLIGSLKESVDVLVKEQHYTEVDLRLRTVYQAQVAIIMAALAPRYQPALAGELSSLASKLSVSIPANIAQLTQFTAARISGNRVPDDSELAIPLAISSGDFDEAARLVESVKNDETRSRYHQLIIKLQARAFLAKGDVIGALNLIRKIEDRNARLGYYLSALSTAQKKRDLAVSSIVVNEVRTQIPQVDRNGLDVRLLLSLVPMVTQTAPDEGAEFLQSAVNAINHLAGKSTGSASL